MKRYLLLVAATAAAWTLTAFAQNRAPQNESIRQDALRADLFFLAGDAMRGRLTDSNENRAASDYIRSRFERAGLRTIVAQALGAAAQRSRELGGT